MAPDMLVPDILIKAGRLIDGTGAAAENNRIISVKNSRIDTVSGSAMLPHDRCHVMDLSEFTLLPGLMDAHVHLFMSGTCDKTVRAGQLDADFTKTAPVIARHLDDHKACGVIAVRDGGDRMGHVLRFKNMHPASGGAVILRTAGRAWHEKGRYGRLIGRHPETGVSLAAAVAGDAADADHVKIVQSGLNSLREFGRQTAPQFAADALKAAAAAAHARNQPVMVHANGVMPVKTAIDAGCDSIEHGFFMGRDNLEKLAEHRIFWVPTACTMQAYAAHLPPGSPEADMARRNLDHQLDQMQLARRLGVPVAAGTDAGSLGVDHGAGLREELMLLLAAGYCVEAAVQCATQHAAELLGLCADYGTLEPGKKACFLAVPGGAAAGESGSIVSRLAARGTRLFEL